MRRSSRNLPKLNYKDIHEGKSAVMSSSKHVKEDLLDYDDSPLDSEEEGGVDIEEEFLQMSEDEFDDEFKKALDSDDLDKVAMLVDLKEKRCKHLKEQVKIENSKEERARRRRKKELEEKFKKLKKVENSMNKSLASSRHNTPNASPKAKVKSTVKMPAKSSNTGGATNRGANKQGMRLDFDATQSQRGESDSRYYNDENSQSLLSSVLNLKRGNPGAFADLVYQAQLTAENCNILSKNNSTGGNFGRHVNTDLRFPAGHDNLGSMSAIPGHGNTSRNPENAANFDTMGSAAPMNTATQRDNMHDILSRRGQQHLINKLAGVNDGERCKKDETTVTAKEEEDNSAEEEEKKTKKKKSGRVAKPDEIDIKKVVRYAHQKLNPKYVKARVFDTLSFSELVAGELELATQTDAPPEERQVRTEIAKCLCYHKQYLQDDELRIGYDVTMKRVEHGLDQWSLKMVDEMHKFFEYRANVIAREALAKADNTSHGKNSQKSVKENQSSATKLDQKGDDSNPDRSIVFCMDFNRNQCNQHKSHIGKWQGKQVMKYHVCRSCLRNNDVTNHSEMDPKCPQYNKKA